uniref:GPI transamidase subunit PIG-U n=1 Tax=Bursaphelenchus xylophilus TaxID=6326 RepID=A0A1I7S194_BURXY
MKNPCPIIFGILLRLIAFAYFKEYLQDHVGFTSPWTSFRRLKDAISLWDQNGSLYADKYHGVPWIAIAFYPFLSYEYFLRVLFIAFDVVGSIFLFWSGPKVFKDKDEASEGSKRMLTMYLLNPLTIGVCVGMNLSSLLNMILCIGFYCLVHRQLCLATIAVCIAAQLNIYYIQLIFPIIAARLTIQSREKFSYSLTAKHLGFKLAAFAVLYSSNFVVSNWREVIKGNIGFFFSLEDYTPNMGMYWYLFSLIFVQYRSFFLAILHFLAFVHVLPVYRVFWVVPTGMWIIFLQLITVLSSYPSYAEFCVFLPLLTTIKSRKNFSVFFYFLATLISLACSSSLITLQQWVQTGSGNANFFFGSVMAYLIGQAFLLRFTLKSLVDGIFYTSEFYKAEEYPEFRFTNVPILKKSNM